MPTWTCPWKPQRPGLTPALPLLLHQRDAQFQNSLGGSCVQLLHTHTHTPLMSHVHKLTTLISHAGPVHTHIPTHSVMHMLTPYHLLCAVPHSYTKLCNHRAPTGACLPSHLFVSSGLECCKAKGPGPSYATELPLNFQTINPHPVRVAVPAVPR
jgi:hypothetical protein